MGFLSGVLESVKDDDAVTTYDNYITDDTKKLQNVLDTLTKNIGSGRTGLAASVDAVKRWLEGYDKNLQNSTNTFTAHLNTLKTNITDNINNISNLDNFDRDVSKWRDTAVGNLQVTLSDAEMAFNKLDNILQAKLKTDFEKIKVRVNDFAGIAERDQKEMMSLGENVKVELKGLERRIIQYAREQKEKCITELQKDFEGNIAQPLNKITSDLEDVIVKLGTWSAKARSVMGAALNKVTKIVHVLEGRENTNPKFRTAVEDSARRLKEKAEELRTKYEEAKKGVEQAVQEARERVKLLDTELQKDLGKLRGCIKEAVTNHAKAYVSKVKGEVEKLKMHIGQPKTKDGKNEDSVYYNWTELKVTIKGLVEKTYKDGHNFEKEGYIGGLLKHVQQYARKVGEDMTKDEGTIDEWVDYICNNNTHMMAYITSYATTNGSVGNLNSISGDREKHEAVRVAIKNEIKQIVQRARDIPQGDRESVEENLEAVGAYLEEIAGLFETYVGTQMVEALASQIEKKILGSQQSVKGSKGYLDAVVDIFVIQLPLIARRIAEEIKALLKDSQIQENVDGAIKMITEIGGRFDDKAAEKLGNDDYGRKITKALGDAQHAVDGLHGKLATALGRDSIITSQEIDINQNIHEEFSKKVEASFTNPSSADKGENINVDTTLTLYAGHKLNEIDKKWNDITKHVPDLQVAPQIRKQYAVTVKQEIIDLHEDFTNEFRRFIDTVKTLLNDSGWSNDRSLNYYLTKLRTMLGDNATAYHDVAYGFGELLKDIVKILGAGTDKNDDNLNRTLENCRIFNISTIRTAVEKHIRQINTELGRQVDAKIQAIKSNSLTRYTQNTKIQLTGLNNTVTGYASAIDDIINNDRQNTAKGLMRCLRKDGGDMLLKLKNHTDLVTSEKLPNLSWRFKDYVDAIAMYVEYQSKTSDVPKKDTQQSVHVRNIKDKFDDLLQHLYLHDKNRYCVFDDKFSKLRDHLSSLSSALDPQALPDAGRPVLKALKGGMMGFVGELGKGYVNKYDGGEGIDKLSKLVIRDSDNKEKLSVDGRNLSKVFLTSLEIMFHDLSYLREECEVRWRECKVYDADDNSHNRLGRFLKDCGYVVPSREGKQDGELKWEDAWTGGKVSAKLTETKITGGSSIYKHILDCESNTNSLGKKKKEDTFDVLDVLGCLLHHVNEYYYVSHLSTLTSTRHPSTVHQMLLWLAGLPHNPVYNDLLLNGLSDLFEKPEKPNVPESKQDSMSAADEDDDSISISLSLPGYDEETVLDAYPYKITASKLRGALASVCTHAHSTLTAILGHGHENGTYACEFNSNAAKLVYPANPSKCIDLLVEVLNRVYSQLVFLNVQCQRRYDTNSWRDCWYGRGIAGSSWTCNEKLCPNQNCPQIADQKTNQTADQISRQTCDQHPKCGVKSPLQSFLEDGLQGFLPHQLTKVGCGVKCSVSNHGGITCKTPMGFADLSNVASHTKQGEYIMKALDAFCGQPDSSLSELCRSFSCLLSTPPKTLGDMFAFYYNFLYGWQIKGDGKDNDKTHRKDAFDEAVTKAYFGAKYEGMELSSLFNRDHSEHNKNRDLISLVCGGDNQSVTNCGRYLQPISANTWTVFSKRNADKYLSWIVYLTESFYNLLDQLYKECCANCTSAGSRCHGKTCVADCKVKSHYASQASAAETKTPAAALTDHPHNKLCKPISHCPSTRPTFCKYGFVFKSLSNMSGENGEETMRTCKDLCNALEKVLSNKITDNAPLAKLVHDVIPKFIWAIREKFFWTTVALWLLSLLYLIHIMVIRLDLLHIKSHLHSPSSHRIAAQSLLAAARVNKLNRVFYLQP